MPLLECLGTSTIKTTVTLVSNVTSTFIYTAFFVFTLVFKFPSSLNFSPIGHNLFPQPVLYFASQSLWGLWRGNTGERNEKLCWLFYQNTGVFPLQLPGGFVHETHEWPCKCTDKLQSWFPKFNKVEEARVLWQNLSIHWFLWVLERTGRNNIHPTLPPTYIAPVLLFLV